MDAQKKTELRVGIVSLLALILLILGITFGKGFRQVMSSNTLKFSFPSSAGIEPGSPIVVNGVRRGAILEVTNQPNGVLITGRIDELNDIKKDASARITILEITGGKKLELNPGFSNEKLNVNNIIQGSNTADIGDLVVTLGEVSTDAVTLVRRLDTLTGEITKLTNDKEFMKKVKSTFDNANIITEDLKLLLKSNSKDINDIVKNARSLTARLDKAVEKGEPKIDTLLAQLNATLGKVDKLMGRGDGLFVKADTLLANANSIINDIKSNKSLVNALLYDKNMKSQLDSTLNSLNNLVNFISNHGVNVNLRLGTRP